MKNRLFILSWAITFIIVISIHGYAQNITIPHQFHLGEIANARKINENFDVIYSALQQLNLEKQLRMYDLTKSFQFTNNSPAKSAEVTANFNELSKYVNIMNRLFYRNFIALYGFYSWELALPDRINENFDKLTAEINLIKGLSEMPSSYFLPDTGQVTSYTDTFGEDNDYLINPQSLTDNGNGTITDNTTGLTWEKNESKLRYDIFSGEADDHCKNLTLAGHTDWRLPNANELVSIILYDSSTPLINTDFFPNPTTGYPYLSSESNYDRTTRIAVYFSSGSVQSRFTSGVVRCVRGGDYEQRWWTDFFEINDELIYDAERRAMWHKQTDPVEKTWEEALHFCETLVLGGYEDWRLPNIRELDSIIDHSSRDPAAKIDAFSNRYWSSTTYAVDYYPSDHGDAWFGDFTHGQIDHSDKTNTNNVRCMRYVQ